jgi:hypothetical protein
MANHPVRAYKGEEEEWLPRARAEQGVCNVEFKPLVLARIGSSRRSGHQAAVDLSD